MRAASRTVHPFEYPVIKDAAAPRARRCHQRRTFKSRTKDEHVKNQHEIGGFSLAQWLGLFAAVALIRAPFLFYYGFSIDAYNNASTEPQLEFFAGQGRFGSYLLFRAFQELGLYGPVPQYAAVLLALPLLCIAAVLLWRTMFEASDRRSPAAVVLGTLLLLAHPYNAEILTFRDAAPVFAISTLLGVGGYYLGVVRGRVVASILLMVCGLSIYQVFINFLAIAWLLGAMLALIEPQRLSGALRPGLRQGGLKGAVLIGASLIAYLVLTKLVEHAVHAPPTARATLIGVGDIPARWREVWAVVRALLEGDLIAKARLASALTVLLWAAGFMVCLRDGRRGMKFFVVPAVAILTCFASIGVILVGREFWPMPRVLAGFSVLPAFGALCAALYLRGMPRNLLLGVLGLLLISYTAIGARVAADQVRVNSRDMVMATILAARMPLSPGQHVAVIGGPDAAFGLGTQRGDMNLSAFWAGWSKVTALSEIYGYPLQAADQAEHLRAIAHCKDSPLWPAMDSARILDGGLAVVCMSRPAE